MNQSLLSVFDVEADGAAASPTAEETQGFIGRVIAKEEEMDRAGAFAFGGALHGPDAATDVRGGTARQGDHRRALRGGQGAHRRLLHHQRRGPRRGAGLGREGRRGHQPRNLDALDKTTGRRPKADNGAPD